MPHKWDGEAYSPAFCTRCGMKEATYRAQLATNRTLEIAATIADFATLPDGVTWAEGEETERFNYGKERAAAAIRAAKYDIECKP